MAERAKREAARVLHRLCALDRELEEIASDRTALSVLALRAHELEDTPGTPVEDADLIRTLLGL